MPINSVTLHSFPESKSEQMIQVIEPGTDRQFDNILDAGKELHDALTKILEERGIHPHDGISVLATAMGGLMQASEIKMDDFLDVVETTTEMWQRSGGGEVTFAPPHRNPNFVPAEMPAGN